MLPDDAQNLDTAEILRDISVYKRLIDKSSFLSSHLDQASFGKLYESYTRKCASLKLIDFDDMPLFCKRLFDSRRDILEKWRDKFEFIMIDEFQDIDPLQFELIKMLSGPDGNVFAVGDDDQSIYGFRGARPEIMLDFKEHFPGECEIFLSENFRSAKAIVEGAGRLIGINTKRIGKNITAVKDDTGELSIRSFESREEEFRVLSEEIKLMTPDELAQTAVLFRNNSLCSFFADVLSSLGVPFKCRERLNDIYDNSIARDILDYLRLFDGEKLRSVFFRVMNHPYRYISREGVSGSEFSFEEVERYHRGDIRTLNAVRKLKRDLKMGGEMNPYAAVHFILSGMGYENYIKDREKKAGKGKGELLKIALEIKERAKGYKSKREFLVAVEEYEKELRIANSKANSEGLKTDKAVTVMTYHAAKGLEYDTVYLPEVCEGIIPSFNATFASDIEEERRLFYVGMTRARDKLFVSYSENYGGKPLKKSRFVDEIYEKTDELKP